MNNKKLRRMILIAILGKHLNSIDAVELSTASIASIPEN